MLRTLGVANFSMTRLLALMIGVAVANLVVASHSEADEAENLLQFGNSRLPIWSALTEFEVNTVNDLTFTSTPSADTLLAFYILASADDREGARFEPYRNRLNEWIDNLEPRLKRKTQLEQGEILFRAMHEEFFLTENDEKKGYVFDQSQLTQVFDERLYNCMSSSLLFVIIAKKMGFDAVGVVIPSHVFVELRLPGSTTIDVETTSRNGFNVVHNAAFYQQDDTEWFTDRNLTPPTYRDYLDREIISATDMGLLDMWSQHTSSARMAYADRMRLAELRAHLLPDDGDAQRARLIFYHEEFSRREQRSDFSGLRLMYDQVKPYIDSLPEDYFSDPEMQNLIFSVKSEMALTDIKTNEEARGITLTRSLLRNVQFSRSDLGLVEHNLFYILSEYITVNIDRGEFLQARQAFADFENYCSQHDICANTVLKLYARWGESYWRHRDWAQAIEVYRDYLTISGRTELELSVEKNMQNAFVNWAGEDLRDGEWESAIVRLETCINEIGTALNCQRDLEKIRNKVEEGYY